MLLDERPFAFNDSGWIYEIKFDGDRLMAEFGSGVGPALRTRKGADARFLHRLKSWSCFTLPMKGAAWPPAG